MAPSTTIRNAPLVASAESGVPISVVGRTDGVGEVAGVSGAVTAAIR